MVPNIRENNIMDNKMDMVNCFIKMEPNIRVNGKMIIWMVKEHYTIIMVNLLIQEIGKMVILKGKEFYIMKFIRNCNNSTTIQVLMKLMIFGKNIREASVMICKTGQGN